MRMGAHPELAAPEPRRAQAPYVRIRGFINRPNPHLLGVIAEHGLGSSFRTLFYIRDIWYDLYPITDSLPFNLIGIPAIALGDGDASNRDIIVDNN